MTGREKRIDDTDNLRELVHKAAAGENKLTEGTEAAETGNEETPNRNNNILISI